MVGELEARAPFGEPTAAQKEVMLEVLEVYLHGRCRATIALEAMLRAASRNGEQGEKVSGFMPFQTTR